MKRQSNVERDIVMLTRQARAASRELASANSAAKDAVLAAIADDLVRETAALQAANSKDLESPRAAELSSALRDRLRLTDARIQQMADGLRDVIALRDPVGETISAVRRPNGLNIAKVRIPLGVIGFIYESRPNVTADAAGLCIKSGNAVILRGGSEAFHSNRAIAAIIQKNLREGGLPEHAVQAFTTTDRSAIDVMLKQGDSIDVVVPRGGKGLIERIQQHATMPVIAHLDGICHTYVDKGADLKMALAVAFNAKMGRPSVCNAMETLLVHQSVAKRFLPKIVKKLQEAGCEVRGCAETRKVVSGVKRATQADWATEYLDTILSVKVVDSLDDALDHIAKYGSAHSDAIVTEDYSASERFLNEVDSAAVFVNASTWFHDGFEFGLGAELGISTNRLHCRGPMGLEELTTWKYQVRGTGQIRN